MEKSLFTKGLSELKLLYFCHVLWLFFVEVSRDTGKKVYLGLDKSGALRGCFLREEFIAEEALLKVYILILN
jgi:hypothetical protein